MTPGVVEGGTTTRRMCSVATRSPRTTGPWRLCQSTLSTGSRVFMRVYSISGQLKRSRPKSCIEVYSEKGGCRGSLPRETLLDLGLFINFTKTNPNPTKKVLIDVSNIVLSLVCRPLVLYPLTVVIFLPCSRERRHTRTTLHHTHVPPRVP